MSVTKSGDDIRAAVLGADRPYRVIDIGGGGSAFSDRPESDQPPCPLIPLGDRSGVYYFLDTIGQERHITARGFGNKAEVRGLLRGDETWLRACWPEFSKPAKGEAGSKVTGFLLDAAAAWLQKFCCAQGLFNETLRFRKPGIWRGESGLPIVHCGDVVLIEGEWHRAGIRTGSQFWVAASPTARPGLPCDASVGQELVDEIQRLWRFRDPGAPQLLAGFIGCGLLGTSIWWRPDIMLTGLGSSGKSSLARVLRATCPIHAHSNDATESGIMGEVRGRVVPIFLDEAFDRIDQETAMKLMDMVLGMSSGDGSRKTRGTADGGYRADEMAGCVLFASVSPPPMRQTHLGRVTMIEMLPPLAGDDHEGPQRALVGWAQSKAPQLWGRIITSAERWHASLPLFREALAKAGCAPREMDQMGALLAGWWILTHEGLPDEISARTGVGVAASFIRTAIDVELDSAPRQAIRHLTTRLLQYDGSTRRELVSVLLERAWRPAGTETDPEKGERVADEVLRRYGLRAMRPCLSVWEWRRPSAGEPDHPGVGVGEGQIDWRLRQNVGAPTVDDPCRCESCFNQRQGKFIPRLGAGAAVWVAAGAASPLFKDALGLDGDRWRVELARLGRPSQGTVRVGGAPERAIWLPREVIDDGGG